MSTGSNFEATITKVITDKVFTKKLENLLSILSRKNSNKLQYTISKSTHCYNLRIITSKPYHLCAWSSPAAKPEIFD